MTRRPDSYSQGYSGYSESIQIESLLEAKNKFPFPFLFMFMYPLEFDFKIGSMAINGHENECFIYTLSSFKN